MVDGDVHADHARLHRVVLWRSLLDEGLEYCGLWRYPAEDGDDAGWAFRGTAVAAYGGVPCEVRYRVICDDAWRTRTVHVGVVQGDGKRALRLRRDGDGTWRSGSEEVVQYQGCVDVDLGIGASTNTLAIRRLGLEVGQAAEIDAAWVRFPDLELARLPQRYTRLAEDRYRYESLDSGFVAELEVDDLALVVRYPGWCERVGASDPAGRSASGSNR
jgi:hypothetical protein